MWVKVIVVLVLVLAGKKEKLHYLHLLSSLLVAFLLVCVLTGVKNKRSLLLSQKIVRLVYSAESNYCSTLVQGKGKYNVHSEIHCCVSKG